MASTRIGTLLLQLRENVTGKAKQAANALKGVENAAKNIKGGKGIDDLSASMARLAKQANALGMAGWGASFQKQLDRLKVNTQDIKSLESAWQSLVNRLNSQQITGVARNNAIAQWKNTVISSFTAARAASAETSRAIARDAKAVERAMAQQAKAQQKAAADAARAAKKAAAEQARAAREHQASVRAMAESMRRGIVMPTSVMLGYGTGAYAIGRPMLQGVQAGANRGSIEARMNRLNYSPEQQEAILKMAEEQAARLGLAVNDVMTLFIETQTGISPLRDAAGKVTKDSQAIATELLPALSELTTLLANFYGGNMDQALTGARDLMKSFDILGVQDPAVIRANMDRYIKMRQILGKDFNENDIKMFAQYSRAAGKTMDLETIFGVMMAYAAERSGATGGTSTRAAFDAIVGERLTKAARKNMAQMGLIDDSGRIAGYEQMGESPIAWTMGVLLPALKKIGVDPENPAQLNNTLTKLFQNQRAADFFMSMIQQGQQYIDSQTKAMSTQGLEAAEKQRFQDPNKGWSSFTDAMGNLAAKVTGAPIKDINSGLQYLADQLNKLSNGLDGKGWGELIAALGIGGGGLLAGGVAIRSILGGITGLIGAGPALTKAAAELSGAAAALRGSAAADAAGDMGKAGKRGGAFSGFFGKWGGLLGRVAGVAGVAVTANEISNSIADSQGKSPGTAGYWNMSPGTLPFDVYERSYRAQQEFRRDPEGARGRAMMERDSRAKPSVDTSEVDALPGKAAEAASAFTTNLNVTATPQVSTSSIDAFNAKVQQAIAGLGRLNSLGNAAISGGMNAATSDYGVSP